MIKYEERLKQNEQNDRHDPRLAVADVTVRLLGFSHALEAAALPERHMIAYDEPMDTLADEDSADAYDHALDHADSRYYTIKSYLEVS